MSSTPSPASVAPSATPPAPLSLRAALRGRELVVVGGTGFLGKVWWAMLLHVFPDVGHLHLLVRGRPGQSSDARFWADVATSEVLEPLRAAHGAGFEEFLRRKITPIDGDVTRPLCGLAPELRQRLTGRVAAIVNVAGIVDFDPPLDDALAVNALGISHLVELARELGDAPILHTSTCYVAGARTGIIEELHPSLTPFPRAHELEPSHWDPAREVAECLDVVEQARHRANDAFRQSHFLDQAKQNLRARCEPTTGGALDDEFARVRRQYVESVLSDLGMERARFWGFPNTYTYTKSIGEQLLAQSGLRFAIGRPSIVESTLRFPFPGWNEGINTSAPMLWAMREGQLQFPGSDNDLDIVPCDFVATGLLLTLGELLDGTEQAVYQYGTTDANPCTTRTFLEMGGLYKLRHHRDSGASRGLERAVHSRFVAAILSREHYELFGPPRVQAAALALSGWLGRWAVGSLEPLLGPPAQALHDLAEQQRRAHRVMSQFLPFVAEYHYTFRCDHTRAAWERLPEEERAALVWEPERIDWTSYFFDVHMAGLAKHVFPLIDEKVKRRKVRAPRPHETPAHLLLEGAERHAHGVAVQQAASAGLEHLSHRELALSAAGVADALTARGVARGDAVSLSVTHDARWLLALFGCWLVGARAVIAVAEANTEPLAGLERAEGVRVRVSAARGQGAAAPAGVTTLSLDELLAAGPAKVLPDITALPVAGADVAVVLTGAAGAPHRLTHAALAGRAAALAPLVPLEARDRVAVLGPLADPFVLLCGVLLPLSRGARVQLSVDLRLDSVEALLRAGRTSVVVAPAAVLEAWASRLGDRRRGLGGLAGLWQRRLGELNRRLTRATGMNAGRALFPREHARLGASLRELVSDGALGSQARALFEGLGIRARETWGDARLGPALAVARPPGAPVAEALPGLELRREGGDGLAFRASPLLPLDARDDEWVPASGPVALDDRGRVQLRSREGARAPR